MNINEIIDQMESGLEVALPGPWVFHPDTMRAIIAHIRELEARAEAAEAKVALAQNLLKRVPGAINSAFAAGTEEREGGSDRRQAKAMAGPGILQQEIRAVLAAMEATDE